MKKVRVLLEARVTIEVDGSGHTLEEAIAAAIAKHGGSRTTEVEFKPEAAGEWLKHSYEVNDFDINIIGLCPRCGGLVIEGEDAYERTLPDIGWDNKTDEMTCASCNLDVVERLATLAKDISPDA